MNTVSFGLGEVSKPVLDVVEAYMKGIEPAAATPTTNFIQMEVRNMGVVTNTEIVATDADFTYIMKIFMSEQPHSTGNISVNFRWRLTEASHAKLFQLMEEATARAENAGAEMHHSIELSADNKTAVLRSFPVDK